MDTIRWTTLYIISASEHNRLLLLMNCWKNKKLTNTLNEINLLDENFVITSDIHLKNYHFRSEIGFGSLNLNFSKKIEYSWDQQKVWMRIAPIRNSEKCWTVLFHSYWSETKFRVEKLWIAIIFSSFEHNFPNAQELIITSNFFNAN